MSEQATEPPPLIAPVERPAAAARVAIGLVALGLLEGVSEIVSIIAAFKAVEHGASAHISFPFGFAAFWFAAWLVWQDKRVIWPILGYLAALGLGSLIGGGLAAVIEFPANLVKAYARNEPAWFGYYAGYFSLSAIFFRLADHRGTAS